MIIVRENSEVVVIYPDLCLVYLLKLVIMSQNIRNVQRLCQYIQYSPMKIKYHLKSHKLYKVVTPPVISWFKNHSIDISTINPSEIGVTNQLS